MAAAKYLWDEYFRNNKTNHMTFKTELTKYCRRKLLAGLKMPMIRKRVLAKRLAFCIMLKMKSNGIKNEIKHLNDHKS